MNLTEEQMQWIKENETMFRVSLKMSPEKLQMLFDLYNHITGESKRVTGCGRCIDNTKKTVYGQYLNQL